MANLGVGSGSSYPNQIDTRQTFRNTSSPAPDSDTRIDSEVINDALASIIAIQTTLGAGVNGVYGSLAARLNAAFPGSGGTPGIISFTNAQSLTIPGSQHNVGQAALLWQLYDNSIPAQAIGAGAVAMSVDTATYDVHLEFGFPLSGFIAIGVQSPLYIGTFSNTSTVSIPGSVHQLPTADILYQFYDSSAPMQAFEPGSVTVDQTTRNFVAQFGVPLSGTVVLSAGGPAYALNFSNTSTLSIPAATHQLGTAALLFQAYDAGTPRAALGDPDVRVNPSTFDIVVNFGIPLSGRMVFSAASTFSGRDFDIRDGGVINQSAVRMQSRGGVLLLQTGSAQTIHFLDKLGTSRVIFDLGQMLMTTPAKLGLAAIPSHLLELGINDAVKPGGGAWSAPCDVRLKEDVEPFTDGLETVIALPDVVRFSYNGLGGTQRTPERFLGLPAQDVQPIAPYLVRTARGRLRPDEPETDLYLLDPTPLPYLLLNCVKTLHAELHAVRAECQRLRTELEVLVTRVAALEPSEEPAP